jgi:16S rRNA processing protein RimM
VLSPLVEVGYVARAHGIRGELRIVTHDPDSRALFQCERVHLGEEAFTVDAVRPTKGAVLVKLEEVGDRNRAEELKGRAVSVQRSDLDLQEDDVLLGDLIGCTVELDGGGSWGEVVDVQLGAQNRLVVVDGEDERLLPVVDAFIVETDLEGRRIVIDPPEGWPVTRRGK